MEVIRYSAEYKQVWDAFVANSKNATFLFYRDYMEYHANRFLDHSLLFFHKNKLLALLPASEQGSEVVSHGGLSYGGILTGASMKVELMLKVFSVMTEYYKQHRFINIIYKTIPHIYHRLPAEEDLYALFKYKAQLYRRDILAVLEDNRVQKYNQLRRRQLKKAQAYSWQVEQSFCFQEFLELKARLLKEKYNARPVHTVEELKSLAARFPDNIKLFTATKDDELGAGVVVYDTETAAHCQYIATSGGGREQGALDAVFNFLLTEVYASKKYFDFGASMDDGQKNGINASLLSNKESYGGRAVMHDFYTIAL